jgi:predicted RNA-binding protein YlxR (DUF448 family)
MVASQKGIILIDVPSCGRGAWICAHSPECFEKAERTGAFRRAFRMDISEDAIKSIRELDVISDRSAGGR